MRNKALMMMMMIFWPTSIYWQKMRRLPQPCWNFPDLIPGDATKMYILNSHLSITMQHYTTLIPPINGGTRYVWTIMHWLSVANQIEARNWFVPSWSYREYPVRIIGCMRVIHLCCCVSAVQDGSRERMGWCWQHFGNEFKSLHMMLVCVESARYRCILCWW